MPTTYKVKKVTDARRFFDEVADMASRLYGRWLDEKDYEDIADYQKPFSKAADKWDIKIIKMTKRPFGLHFEDTYSGIKYALKVTSTSVSYKNI